MAKKEKTEYGIGAYCSIGYITKVFMHDSTTHYMIGEFRSLINNRKTNRPNVLVIKGNCDTITKGGLYRLEFRTEPKKNEDKLNWEVYFTHCEAAFDTSEFGCINYLKNEIPGLGEVKARQLFRNYGKETIEILRTDPVRVASEVHGITIDLACDISEHLKSFAVIDKIKQELYGIGITQWQVNAIIKQHGVDALTKLKEDCFSLTEIRGLGFNKVSAIADKLGIPKTDPGRIKAAMVYAMDQFLDEGHVCVMGHELIHATQKLLDLKHVILTAELEQLVKDKLFATQDSDPEDYVQDSQIFDSYNGEGGVEKTEQDVLADINGSFLDKRRKIES